MEVKEVLKKLEDWETYIKREIQMVNLRNRAWSCHELAFKKGQLKGISCARRLLKDVD